LVTTVERLGSAESGVRSPGPVGSAGAVRSPASVPGSAPAVTFAEDDALRRTSGVRKLLKQLVSLCRADARISVRKIEQAVKKKNAEALRTAAHGLKGSVATVGGMAARDAAARLESLGKSGHLKDAGAALKRLRAELAQLDKAFARARLISDTRGRRR